ncbi:MAG TPA: protein kinase [Vicinamibacterales bacterium]|nr:protein kinase [Vicinamibacterales bacterium]
MNSEQWNCLSDWHNAWLDADADGRLQLRAQLTANQPDLLADADDLIAAGPSLDGFLETPAFVLAARQLAHATTALATGADVGPYRVVSLIGHGGMAVVYRATDVRLHRDVALKMLAPIGVSDELRVERFLREARITASIDHPNVVKVYDVGVFEGHPYIVVELLEGETLRARLNRDALTPAVARQIATDIARGLIAAHAVGLVHRDLKPENIFLTRAGSTKILDFGIAKLAPEATRPQGAPSTITGILVGTAGYLAPEQILGQEIDARADLFALGSILFELITGQRAFACENTVDTLHAILHAEPPDLIRQNDVVPDVLANIVSRLLEKAPADRFQSAADLTWALEQAGAPASAAAHPMPAPSSARWAVAAHWAWVAALLALVTMALGLWRILSSRPLDSAPGMLTRFTWTLPTGTRLLSAPIASPDGRRICWVGGSESGLRQVFVRDLSSLDATPVPGTEGGRHPFWSADSQAIGFFARGKLQRVALDGGAPIVLADAPDPRGGTWGRSGVIVFQPQYRDTSLMRVSDQGGDVKPVTFVDRAQEETAHRWPAFLPDGVHFVYSIVSLRDGRRGVYLGSLDDPPLRPIQLFASDSAAVYAPLGDGRHGVLLSVRNGRVEARPFDPVRRVLEGPARTIGVDAIATSLHDAALLTATTNVLAYSAVMMPWGARVASVGRDGADLQFLTDRESGGFPRISPDGGRLARARVDILTGNPDIWLDDLRRGTRLRLTTSADLDVMPVWSPDGREIAYRSGTVHETTIGFAASDGTGVTRTLACPQQPCEPNDWSPDGKYLVVTVDGKDLWTVPLQRGATPQKLLAEPFTERDARISPDGRWLAYVSDESGRAEVSVRSLGGPSRRIVVSSEGGDQPVWSHDGGQLFFAAGEGSLYSVSVRPDAHEGLAFGPVTRLKVPRLGDRHWGTSYDVSADARRVYFSQPGDERPPREFGVVMNWSALLK